jgi:predicted DNA-binding protein with PD1-like motif
MSQRTIRHPGPTAEKRHAAVACSVVPVTLTLEPGRTINAAIAEAFAAKGFEGGYVLLKDVPMRRMNYVIPAGSPDAEHAAWYSDTRAPETGGTILRAGLHMGRRDGEPFLHCHGSWEVPGEGVRMGHLLPFEAEVKESVEVEAFALAGAVLDVADDAETNFRLFAPRASQETASHPMAAEAGRKAVLATVRPNGDISEAIERICAENGLETATVHGIGSLIGADYADGSHVSSYATEVLVRDGRVAATPEGLRASLDIALVGMDGDISAGILVHGANPVCVTFELLIVG